MAGTFHIPEEEFRKLLARESTTGLDAAEALNHLGLLIDGSLDHDVVEGVERALQLAEEVEARDLPDPTRCNLDYLLSNAWADLYLLTRASREDEWKWEQPELEKQIFHLRSAATFPDTLSLHKDLACRIHTNLANAMDTVGRFVEATGYWQKALEIDPSFGMAQGNLGFGLCWYARTLYDRGHACVFLSTAHHHLKLADGCKVHLDEKAGFLKRREEIEEFFGHDPAELPVDLDGHSLGETGEEIGYRKWCLKNRLFLNPLNDIVPNPIAAQDILTQPSIVVGIGEGPYYAGFYNQMKQEFASARYLFYEGRATGKPHFSDAGVKLYNTLDYPCYGLSTEKLRIAFRMAYSLLDKIAFFLNHYLQLGIKPRQVSFRTLWYEKGQRDNGLRPFFEERPNLPLRGLYWLGKDLFEDREGFQEAMEPDGRELNTIRNHLEHKYLKLHDDYWPGPDEARAGILGGLSDTLAFSLHARDFEKRALKLLKMARAALIYLSLSVHEEERRRRSEMDENAIILPMPLELWDDDWKR